MPDKIQAVGTKAQVWHFSAKHTSGGLKRSDLMKHKGRIISRKKHAAGKKAIKHLRALGYIAKKGTFKLMSKSMARSPKSRGKRGKSRSTRKRGGFWFEGESKTAPAGAAPSVSDMMKAMGSVSASAAGPYAKK
jgi:hypothetical protein